MAEDHDHTSGLSLGEEVAILDEFLSERLDRTDVSDGPWDHDPGQFYGYLTCEKAKALASLITTQAKRIEELTAERDEARAAAKLYRESYAAEVLQASEARATRAEGERDEARGSLREIVGLFGGADPDDAEGNAALDRAIRMLEQSDV